MSGVGLLRSSPSLARIGGRAPAHWQRQMARRTARLDALRRATAWAEALLAPFPVLGEGPLFGRSLGTIFQYETSRPPGRSPQAPAAQRVQRAWGEQPSGQADGDAREAAASTGQPLSAAGHRAAPSPTFDLDRLPARVDGARLARLVGTAPGGERNVPPRRRPPGEQGVSLADKAPLPPGKAGSCQDWLRDLTRRVEHRLFRYQPGGGPAPDSGRSLGEPYADLRMGPVAPEELLARAAGAPGEPGPSAVQGPQAGRPDMPARDPGHMPWAGSLPEHPPDAGALKPPPPAAVQPARPARARTSVALDGGRAGERARASPGPPAVQGPQPERPGLPDRDPGHPARPGPLSKNPPGAGSATQPAGPAGALDGGRAGERARSGASKGPQRTERGGGIASQRIGGLMAPLELLHALNRPPRGALPEGRAGGDGGEGHPPEARLRQEPPSSSAGQVGLGVAPEEMPPPFYPEAPGRQESEPTAGISPPTLAPSYPFLAPPRTASAPPAPIATAVVQRGAGMTEAAQAGSDLGELATKIKRILDEEARRHGIDV